MNKKFTKLIAALALLVFMTPSLAGWGQTRTVTYEKLTSIANIDESAQYVLGIEGTGFVYTIDNGWGKLSLPANNTPYCFTLVKANDGNSFKAKTKISNTDNYLVIATPNSGGGNFSMNTSSSATNTDIIIGTTATVATGENAAHAVANKTTTARHLRKNGDSGVRSYAGNTGNMVFFYKVVYKYTVTYDCNGGESGCPTSPVNNVPAGDYTLADAPTRENFTFDGWSDGSNTYDAGATYNLTSDKTFTAQWSSSLTPSDFALTGAPITLSFDLYNNSDAQTIHYTTSSTGAVTVGASDYVTTSVNATDQTITVTPTAVTPSAQTITVNQAADANYAAGSTTFTVNITNSAPSITISGNGIVNNVVNLNCNDADTHTATVAYANINNPSPTLGIFSNLDCTQAYEGSDFLADFASANIEAIEYAFMNANTDPDNARTVYIRVAVNAVYSNVITITQGAYIPTYDVMFETDGGTFVENEDFPSDAETKEAGTYALPSATKIGYTFVGWYDGDLVYAAGDEYTISRDVEFTAQWAQGGRINFGNNGTKINGLSVTGDDSFGKVWTVTVVFPGGASSYGQSTDYSQVGANGKPADPITFTSTISASSVTVTNMSAKFGGFSGTTGTITLKVGETVVGTGYLNEGTDVIINSDKVAIGTDLTVIVDNTSNKGIKCYYISYSFTTKTDPVINAPATVNLYSNSTNNEFGYAILHPISGKSLTATTTADWISNINVTDTKVTFETTPNQSATENRTATITLHYDGAVNKTVTVVQSKIDYITMPFAYDGDGINNLPAGLTSDGLGSAYSSSPYMQFNSAGDWLVLRLNEPLTSLSYDIKAQAGNNTWAGSFKVQTSVDGVTYNDLVNYESLAAATQSITHLDFDTDVRYIRWFFTTRDMGNVALGNIHASAAYDVYGTVTVATISPTANKKCTVYNKGILTVTGTLNNENPANLIIEDGGQLVTGNEIAATVQKSISKHSSATGLGNTDGWYFIASPINSSTLAPNNVSNMLTTESAAPYSYDLYRFNQDADKEWENYHKHSDFTLANGQGYLYANANDVTLEFAGNIKPYSSTSNTVTLAQTGWNLIGNPFTCKVGVNVAFNELNNGSSVVAKGANSTIMPCAGILVYGDEGTTVTFTGVNTGELATNNTINSSSVQMTLTQQVATRGEYNTNTLDNAIVSFNEGSQLPKFYFGTQNANLYIPQGTEEYAIVSTEAQGEMPVNFRANENGNYTLTVNPENVETNYLHLIDNMTGADIDLLQTPSYSFEAKTTDYESRFRLVFAANNEDGVSTGSTTFAFISNGNIIVNGEGTLQVIDVTGRLLFTREVNSSLNTPHSSLTPGVYIIRLINGDNVRTQKIVIE